MARRRKEIDYLSQSVQGQSATPSYPCRLKKWDEIPSWLQDNEYILSGYRQPAYSFASCLRSMARLHNETVNIYSHLVGAAFFSIAPIYLYKTLLANYEQATCGDMIVFAIFFYGVAICFLLSST
ncbi:MAG: hypothetical protein Q9194_005563 [Teloschistes cf. exilis]